MYSSAIIRVIKSRIKWVEHVARVEEGRGAYRVLVGRPYVKDHLEGLGMDVRIILKWIFKKWNEKAWTGLI
jgi:hypothetical protein